MHPSEEEAELLTLMVTPEEKQRLEAAAALLGVTVEEFVVTAAHEGALRATAPKECDRRQVMGLEDFTEADLQAIRNAEPPPEAAAFDHEEGSDLDQTLAETRAKFADLSPEGLQALVDEAIASARRPAKKWV